MPDITVPSLSLANAINFGHYPVEEVYLGTTKIWPKYMTNEIPVPMGYVGQTAWAPSTYFGCASVVGSSDGWITATSGGSFKGACSIFLARDLKPNVTYFMSFEATNSDPYNDCKLDFGSPAVSIRVPPNTNTPTSFSGYYSSPYIETIVKGSTGNTAGSQFKFRKVLLVESSTPVAYFDGNSGANNHWWSGAPNASPSRRLV